jgi:hypothetical protein
MNKKLNFVNENHIQDLIKNDISKIKDVKIKDIYNVLLGDLSNNPIGEAESLDKPWASIGKHGHSLFSSLPGSPLSKHPKFKNSTWQDLVDYAKKSESNKEEAKKLFKEEYIWWLSKTTKVVRLPGSFIIPKKRLEKYLKSLSSSQKDPFDVQVFDEYVRKSLVWPQIMTIIGLIKIIGVIWYMWLTLSNL